MREPSLEVVIGQKGVGKTYLTKQIIRDYVKNDRKTGRKARPVLVMDVNGEYDECKAIDFDVENENEYDRAEQIRAITVPKAYRILPFKKNREPMTPDDIIAACKTIARYFSNGLFVMEDINRYMMSNLKIDIIGLLVGLRHKGIDLLIHYQALKPLPPRVWQNVNYIRWHKQTDNIDVYKSRIPNYELCKIAELIVNRQYKGGNIRFCLWVSMQDEKLVGVTDNQFMQGCEEYLALNYNEVRKMMRLGITGNDPRKFDDESQARQAWIDEKKTLYL